MHKHWDSFLFQEHGNIRLRQRINGSEEPPESQHPEQNRYLKRNCYIISLPTYAALVVLIIGLLLFWSVYALHYRLPTPLSLKDIESHPERFIAERALNHLRQLASYGSKPVGSYENEVLAVEFLTREISFIMQQANPEQKISFDIQKCAGSYFLAYKPYSCTNYYSQVQNLVVKLSSGTNSSSSLLINCHFDSAPTSPGRLLYCFFKCVTKRGQTDFGDHCHSTWYFFVALLWSFSIVMYENVFKFLDYSDSIKQIVASDVAEPGKWYCQSAWALPGHPFGSWLVIVNI